MNKKYLLQLTDEYECTEYVTALLEHILNEVGRVYLNREQKQWDRSEDPKIPTIKYKPYYCGEDEKEAKKANFSFDMVEIRWCKHVGKDMIVNKEYNVAQWKRWFDRCLAQIRKQDTKL